MKKSMLTFLVAVILCVTSNAQLKRNSFMVRTSFQHHEQKSASATFLGGELGYFPLTNFAIGVSHAVFIDPGVEFALNGVFGRYYYKEKLIAGLAYKSVMREREGYPSKEDHGLNVELGYSHALKRIFAIDLLLNYNTGRSNSHQSVGASIGGTFFFNRGKAS